MSAVLVIAGSDSSGGAGAQRDLRVLADFGVRAVTALTAVTTQTDHQILSSLIPPPNLIRDQIKAALCMCPIAAVKIGMLGNAATVEAVVNGLDEMRGIPIILDPVLVSSSGASLLDENGQQTMRTRLFPLVALLTPNMPEAAALLGEPPAYNEETMLLQANLLLGLGTKAVLLKGGHGTGNLSVDLLVEEGKKPIRLVAARLPTTMRGTGCALSSAIAAQLAVGKSLAESCQIAKAYLFKKMKISLANAF